MKKLLTLLLILPALAIADVQVAPVLVSPTIIGGTSTGAAISAATVTSSGPITSGGSGITTNNYNALALTPSYTTTGTNASTDFLINRTGTNGSGAQNLMDLQVGGSSQFKVSNTGIARFNNFSSPSGGGPITVNSDYFSGSITGAVLVGSGNYSGGSGAAQTVVNIRPTYVQSGTASATDLQIYRTETSVGSGPQYLIEAGTSVNPTLFTVTNGGAVSASYIRSWGGIVFNSTLLDSSSHVIIISTAPLSGGLTNFGTGATVSVGTNSAAFQITTGTGGIPISTAATITMPTGATTGWIVNATDVTNNATTVFSAYSTSTTNVNVYAYSRTTGASVAVPAGEVIRFSATAF